MQAIAIVSLVLAGFPRAGDLKVAPPSLRLSLPKVDGQLPDTQRLRGSTREASLETQAVASAEQPRTTRLRALAHARDFVRFGEEWRAVTPLTVLRPVPPQERWPSFASSVHLTSSTGLPCVVRLELAGKDGATLSSGTRTGSFQAGAAELIFRWPSLQPVDGPVTLRVLIDGRLEAERPLPVAGRRDLAKDAPGVTRTGAKRAGRRR